MLKPVNELACLQDTVSLLRSPKGAARLSSALARSEGQPVPQRLFGRVQDVKRGVASDHSAWREARTGPEGDGARQVTRGPASGTEFCRAGRDAGGLQQPGPR